MVTHGTSGATFYRSERNFLESVSDNSYSYRSGKSKVTIYEEVEGEQPIVEYKNKVLLQKEREEQLSLILDSDPTIMILNEIRSRLRSKNI